jgi:polar amino acid transport system substrate-binding protein
MAEMRRRWGLGLTAALPMAVLVAASPAAVAQSPSPLPTLSAECAKDALRLKNQEGLRRLTLSTDNPSFPPWWGGDAKIQYPNEPEGGSGFRGSDPYSGEGYEAATAYAVAAALGFGPDEVDWIPNSLFELAFQPGLKPFDWHMAQIAITPERAEAVDFSDPYFDSNQSLLAMTGTPITEVTTVEGLRDFKLGAAVATTAFTFIEDVIQPNTEISVLSDNAAALQALRNGQIDGLVVDLSTAFYMRDAQLEDWDTPEPEGTVVGQFGGSAPTDRMGMVLEKGSPLTRCVNEALAIVKASGQLQEIHDTWISTGQDVPYFE